MKVCVFDTETTGLFDFSKRAHEEGQPRMCALAAVLFDDADAQPLENAVTIELLVKPDGWNNDAVHINGLTMERLEAEGVPVADVLVRFDELLTQADVVAGYNVNFDLKVHRGESRRAERPDGYGDVPKLCLMFASKQALKVRSIKLVDAVEQLLDRVHEKAHTAMGDCRATADLYFELKRRGQLPEPKRDVPNAEKAA